MRKRCIIMRSLFDWHTMYALMNETKELPNRVFVHHMNIVRSIQNMCVDW